MAQDIKKRIEKFIKKYPEPIQKAIILEWKRKDGWHQQKYFCKNATDGIIRYNTGHKIVFSQFRYDEKLGLCELAYAEFPHNTPKVGENRRWFYVARYFIPKGERVLYNADGTTGNYKCIRASYEYRTNNVVEFARHFAAMHGWRNSNFNKEFLRFCGEDIKCKAHWNGDTITNVYHLPDWFKYVPKTRTTGKVQQTIDTLIANGIGDIDNETKNKMCLEADKGYWRKNVAYFDVERKVFRCFAKLENGELIERKRVYMGKKPIVATLDENEGWIPNGSFTERQFNATIVNCEDVSKIKYCAYLKDVVGQSASVYKIVSIMRHNEIEQLYNMGCIDIAKYLADNVDYFNRTVENCFGATTKAKNVCQKYQLTKKQLDHTDEHFHYLNDRGWYHGYNHIIRHLKRIFGNNLASIDLNTFTTTYDAIKYIDNWRLNSLLNSAPNTQTILRFLNMNSKHDGAITILTDTVNSYNSISRANKPQTTPWECKSYDELVRLHDACVRIRNMEVEEQRRLWDMEKAERDRILEAKRKKLDEERIKMNYEDDEFIIRLPKTLVEIVNEGSALGHCVGGYTQNHAQGNCTIMFLRKKSDPDISFYTIEVTPSNTIQQIHGRYNRWLGNNPEAIPTVVRWLRKNGIACSNEILTCKSVGYGKTNEYVAMPQVD